MDVWQPRFERLLPVECASAEFGIGFWHIPSMSPLELAVLPEVLLNAYVTGRIEASIRWFSE